MTQQERRFIKNLTQSERERYKKLGIPLAVAAKFEARLENNIPIPTSDCHGYQIACLCGQECPKFNEAYELGVRDDECAIFDEIMEEIKLKEFSDKMIELQQYMAHNIYLQQDAKYVVNSYADTIFFFSERAVINFLWQHRYRMRDFVHKGDGEWESKNKRILIRKIKII